MRFATLVKEEGRSGNAGAEVDVEVGAVAVVAILDQRVLRLNRWSNSLAVEVPPLPALSQGLGGDDEAM